MVPAPYAEGICEHYFCKLQTEENFLLLFIQFLTLRAFVFCSLGYIVALVVGAYHVMS